MDHWPEDGTQFIHVDDVLAARKCIPSTRVFRRDKFDGEFYHCVYGGIHFRIRPSLWQTVASEGFDIGDEVETIGVGMQRELFVGKIASMEFSQSKRQIVYQLERRQVILPRQFQASELRLLVDKTRIRPRPEFLYIPASNYEDEYRLRAPMERWADAND